MSAETKRKIALRTHQAMTTPEMRQKLRDGAKAFNNREGMREKMSESQNLRAGACLHRRGWHRCANTTGQCISNGAAVLNTWGIGKCGQVCWQHKGWSPRKRFTVMNRMHKLTEMRRLRSIGDVRWRLFVPNNLKKRVRFLYCISDLTLLHYARRIVAAGATSSSVDCDSCS
jgi:hypothetical protein